MSQHQDAFHPPLLAEVTDLARRPAKPDREAREPILGSPVQRLRSAGARSRRNPRGARPVRAEDDRLSRGHGRPRRRLVPGLHARSERQLGPQRARRRRPRRHPTRRHARRAAARGSCQVARPPSCGATSMSPRARDRMCPSPRGRPWPSSSASRPTSPRSGSSGCRAKRRPPSESPPVGPPRGDPPRD